MKYIKINLIKGFHFVNLILIIFYLYPGSIFGYFLYNNSSIQPQITEDFSILDLLISSNHLYIFIFFSTIVIFTYRNTNKINFMINYLFFLSVVLEFFHIFIPNRGFEFRDLFGNILGVVIVIIIYKIKRRYG